MSDGPLNPSLPFAVVVNDDRTQLNMLSWLVRKAGLEPRVFTGAEAALEEMKADAQEGAGVQGVLPALIVTDLYMPGIDGWRFCRLLRSPEYAAFNKIPIVVVSATFAGDEPGRIAMDLGVEAFFPSPVDGGRFVEQVHAILGGRRAPNKLRALIVEDSEPLADALGKTFTANGYQVDTKDTISAAAGAFRETFYDIALLDYHLPDGRGDSLLDVFHSQRPDCVCIMMTTDPGPELALDWMKRGAAAYVHKPFQPDYLVEMCARARRERALLRVEDLLKLRTRELKAREEKYRNLYENAPVGIFRTNSKGQALAINTVMAGILGFESSSEAVEYYKDLGKQLYVHADRREEFLLRLKKDGKVENFEYEAKTADGRRIWLTMNAHVRRLDGGEAFDIEGFTMDISDRKRVEDALRESEMRYRSFISHSSEGIYRIEIVPPVPIDLPRAEIVEWINNHAIIGEVNNALASMYGLQPKDMIWKRATDFAPDYGGRVVLVLDRKNYQNIDEETVDIDNQGNPLYLRESYYGEIEDGRLERIWGVQRDITDSKRAEEEKTKLEAQLQQAQKMESVGRLAGGVAHDFNNMLGVILGHAEMAMESVDPAQPLYADLEEIRKAAERSADLTRQLLVFARRQTVAPRVLDLNETVAGMLKMLQRMIGENIRLDWLPEAELWPVRIDPSQIDQILANLCVNARDAIADVGRISIETGNSVFDEAYCADHAGITPGEYVRLAVSDDGCGMGRETLSHLFEPFFTTKGIGEGTGLGLATVYGAVKQNNGFINTYSEPGIGTTFTIYLPRHAGRVLRAPAAAAAEPAVRGHETILLVEDEPAILELTRKMLEKHGFTVLTAGAPGEAIRIARERAGEIHLLMTDVVMPEMNGRELAKNLLALYPEIKRLFMSGYTADVIAHRGVLDEGVRFIQKPFSTQTLVAKVREVLDGE